MRRNYSQGREPGVVGLSGSGLAGEAMKIRIRGNASLTQSNEPIIFVDGIRISSGGTSGGGASLSHLDDIDPSTIERIEILKGAAAATLYGTEASNGVIQIFTKKGTVGAPKWDVNISQDFSNYPTNRLEDNFGVPVRQGQLDSLKKLWGRTDLALHAVQPAIPAKFFETGSAQTVNAFGHRRNAEPELPRVGELQQGRRTVGPQRLEGLAKDVVRRSGGRMTVNVFPISKLRVGAQAQYVNTFANRPQYGNNIYSPVTLLEFGKPDLGQCNNSDPDQYRPWIWVSGPPGKCKFAGESFGSPTAFEPRVKRRKSSTRSASTASSRRSTCHTRPSRRSTSAVSSASTTRARRPRSSSPSATTSTGSSATTCSATNTSKTQTTGS